MVNSGQMGSFNVVPKQNTKPQGAYGGNTPKLIKLVIQYSGGSVQTERQASMVLVGFVVVIVLISFFLVFRGGPAIDLPPESEILQATPNTPILE